MFAKISLTVAFLLMITPPIACASNHEATNPASIAWSAHESPPAAIVVAQQPPIGIFEKNQADQGASENEKEKENENDNDSETNENGDDNQNADGAETDQENTAGIQQSIPPQILGGPGNDAGGAQMAPQMNGYAQPVNPNQ